MKMLLAVGLLLPLLSVSCASIHGGKMATAVNKEATKGEGQPIKISAERIKLDNMPTFDLIEVTIENDSMEWFKISHTDILIGDPGTSGLSMVVGKDLEDWATAVQARASMDAHNRSMWQAGLVAAGAVAAGSRNDGVAIAGLIAIAGVEGSVVADIYRGSYVPATQSKKVPSNHFLQPISIPAKMFVRRWVLLNVPPNAQLAKLVVDVETADGKKANYALVP